MWKCHAIGFAYKMLAMQLGIFIREYLLWCSFILFFLALCILFEARKKYFFAPLKFFVCLFYMCFYVFIYLFILLRSTCSLERVYSYKQKALQCQFHGKEWLVLSTKYFHLCSTEESKSCRFGTSKREKVMTARRVKPP